MNEPLEPVTPGEWQEVQRAYREVPPTAPSSALDARVRAAVEAELAASAGAPPRSAQVIEFPRWRRVAVPLAAAATIVVAVGVAWLARTSPRSTSALVASEPAPAGAPAPVPAARDVPAESAPLADATNASGPARKEERPAMPPSPPAPAAMAPEPRPALAREPLMETRPAAPAVGELRLSRAAGAANDTLAGFAAPLPPPTLDQVRQLVRDGQVEAARAMFKRWREAHAAEAVPDDLKQLAAEAAR